MILFHFIFLLNFSLHQNKTIKITHQCFSLSICSLQIVFYCMLGLHLFLMIMAISFRLCLLVRYVKSSPSSCWKIQDENKNYNFPFQQIRSTLEWKTFFRINWVVVSTAKLSHEDLEGEKTLRLTRLFSNKKKVLFVIISAISFYF